MEISMRDLFPICVKMLDQGRTPLHYKTLTEQALFSIGVKPTKEELLKNAENVREKLLIAEQFGTFYSGKPLCMGALRHWFISDQLQFTTDWITIPGNAQAGATGAFEALMRSKYMVIHNPSLRNTELLNRQRASGLVLEHHVSAWFKSNYPELYQDPENNGMWDKPCNHDFKLTATNPPLKVDVSGPDWHGRYGHRGKKPKADVHLLCRISGASCTFEGVVRGDSFSDSVIPMNVFSPTAFLVWLNCIKNGIDYRALSACLSKAQAKAA